MKGRKRMTIKRRMTIERRMTIKRRMTKYIYCSRSRVGSLILVDLISALKLIAFKLAAYARMAFQI
jgi:hypothetical protein